MVYTDFFLLFCTSVFKLQEKKVFFFYFFLLVSFFAVAERGTGVSPLFWVKKKRGLKEEKPAKQVR